MIDSGLREAAQQAIWWFWAKKILFVYVMPMVLGFLVATLYPIGSRFAAAHRPFVVVMCGSAVAPAVMLLGWSFVARAPMTAVWYGIGYGFGAALLSRVHSIRLWPVKIVTRRQAYRKMALRLGGETPGRTVLTGAQAE